jgi:hypothetical protein
MTSTFSSSYSLTNNYFYITRRQSIATTTINQAGRWDGTTSSFQQIGTAPFTNPSAPGLTILPISDTNIYICGAFTNYIAQYNGSTWTIIGPGNFTNTVQHIAWDNTNNLLYAVSQGTSTVANRIQVWNGTTWTSLGGKPNAPIISTYGYLEIEPTTGNVYLSFSSSLFRYNKVADNWTNIGNIGGTSRDLKYSSLTHSMFIASSSVIRFYNITNNAFSSTSSLSSLMSSVFAVDFDNNGRLYVCGMSSSYINSILYYNASLPTDTNGSWVAIFNHQDVSGVLELIIDTNKNIFAFGNTGGLILGTYQGSNTWSWANYSQGSSTISISGKASGGFGSGSGDPHITTVCGTKYFLETKKYFRLFDNNNNNNRFFVNAKCSKGKYPIWRSKEYISTLYFQIGEEYLIVNLGFRGELPKIDKSKLSENSKFEITEVENEMIDVISFCSNCKFKSKDKVSIEKHIEQNNHVIINNIRGQIKISVYIDKINPIIFTIENVNEHNFEPCKVIIDNLQNHNIMNYSGAIIRKLGDYCADISCLYDNAFLFDI